MVNRPKNKGTAAETMLVNYLREHGWPEAERRTLSGIKDKGDVSGTGPLVWECKSTSGNPKIPAWLAETEIERINAEADFGILVIKQRGVGARNVAGWWAVLPLHAHESLKSMSGWKVQTTPTFSYSAQKFRSHLEGLIHDRRNRQGTGDLDELVAVTMMPPGARDEPERHYRVMHLWEMVKLLNAAGYYRQGMAPSSGASNSQPGSEAPPLARSGE